MKKLLIVLFLINFTNAFAQVASQNFTSKEFGWAIKIPAGFEGLSTAQKDALNNKGLEIVEEAYDLNGLEDVVIPNTTLFAVKKSAADYMEANFQAFDVATDGSYDENVKNIYEIMYQSLSAQMPAGIKIEKNLGKEVIAGKEFDKIALTIALPDNTTLHMFTYMRLFGKKDFTLSIIYIDNKAGKLMMDAFKNSTFK